ncbi:MAG: type I-U CRISPR-associated RAMP protein Csb1/Cas7u [Bryobacteraceae bacterium]
MPDIKADLYDSLLDDNGPAAITLCRRLTSVEGEPAWIFPPTFAQSESSDEDDEAGSGGKYQIDSLSEDGRKNVCLIDSVGSQANRMEPVFKRPPYSAMVPQMIIKLKDGDEVNLLDAGHRAADAVVRFSAHYGPLLSKAFKDYRERRDCSELVRLAPTSLIFGVWDSRATGTKIQRVVRSVIRAYDVSKAERSATFQAAYDFVGNGMISPDHDKGSGKNNPLSEQGFKYSLATKTHGGVVVRGEIRQDAAINLVALRMISDDRTIKRYLLGLALVALSYRDQQAFNLREGCLLRAATKKDYDGQWIVVHFDSTEDQTMFAGFTHEMAMHFAQDASADMKVEKLESDTFDQATAERWLRVEKKTRKRLSKVKHPSEVTEQEASVATKEKKSAPK